MLLNGSGGVSARPIARAIGQLHFWRDRGRGYIETVRPWLQAAFVGTAAVKYLGLSTQNAIAFGIGLLVVVEVLSVLFGLLDHRRGVIEAHNQLAIDTNPYSRETLRLFRLIEAELRWQRLHVVMRDKQQEGSPRS